LDYGHNVPALEASVQAVRNLVALDERQPRRLIGVIASPGDRQDDRIVALGRAAAGAFNLVFLKEDHDLRGREPGKTAGLLLQGALEVAPAEAVKVVLDEGEAIREALKTCTRNDLLVVYYEKYDEAYQSIMRCTQEMSPVPEDAAADAMAETAPVAQGKGRAISGGGLR